MTKVKCYQENCLNIDVHGMCGAESIEFRKRSWNTSSGIMESYKTVVDCAQYDDGSEAARKARLLTQQNYYDNLDKEKEE